MSDILTAPPISIAGRIEQARGYLRTLEQKAIDKDLWELGAAVSCLADAIELMRRELVDMSKDKR